MTGSGEDGAAGAGLHYLLPYSPGSGGPSGAPGVSLAAHGHAPAVSGDDRRGVAESLESRIMTQPGSHDFTVTDTELLIDAPIIAMRRDQVVMPGGDTASREIVEHFGAVAVVAVRDNEIALVRQYRRSAGRRLWELPAGLLDIANENALTCAQRELQEEAGLAAGNWALLVDMFTSPGVFDEAVRIYLAGDLTEVDRPVSEHEEADMEFAWVPVDRARGMVMSGEVNNAIAIAGIMTAAEVIAGRAAARDIDTPFVDRPSALADRRIAAGRVPDMKQL